jgi:predicted dienelactone hydrolase
VKTTDVKTSGKKQRPGNDRLWRTSRWIPEGRHPDEADISNEEQQKAMQTLVRAGIVCSDCLATVPLPNSRVATAIGF